MNSLLENDSLTLNAKRGHGRVVNAVADLLRSKLSVPEIYIEPKIASGIRPDILAVDLAGSGDIYGVEIKIFSVFPTRTMLRNIVLQLKDLPFHFKYLAMPSFSPDRTDSRRFSDQLDLLALFDVGGIGRIGIISFDPNILKAAWVVDKSSVAITVPAERFRVKSDRLVAIEKYISKTPPDMTVRL